MRSFAKHSLCTHSVWLSNFLAVEAFSLHVLYKLGFFGRSLRSAGRSCIRDLQESESDSKGNDD
jgi:hypothetical protein